MATAIEVEGLEILTQVGCNLFLKCSEGTAGEKDGVAGTSHLIVGIKAQNAFVIRMAVRFFL